MKWSVILHLNSLNTTLTATNWVNGVIDGLNMIFFSNWNYDSFLFNLTPQHNISKDNWKQKQTKNPWLNTMIRFIRNAICTRKILICCMRQMVRQISSLKLINWIYSITNVHLIMLYGTRKWMRANDDDIIFRFGHINCKRMALLRANILSLQLINEKMFTPF